MDALRARATALVLGQRGKRHAMWGLTAGSAFGFAAGVVVDVAAVPAVLLAVAVGAAIYAMLK